MKAYSQDVRLCVPNILATFSPALDYTVFNMLEEPLESPRHLSWLLLRDRASLNHQEQQMLAFIRQERTIDVVGFMRSQKRGRKEDKAPLFW